MSKISAHFKLKKQKRQDNETETVTLDSTDDKSTSVAADLSVLYFKNVLKKKSIFSHRFDFNFCENKISHSIAF